MGLDQNITSGYWSTGTDHGPFRCNNGL